MWRSERDGEERTGKKGSKTEMKGSKEERTGSKMKEKEM